MDEGLEAKVDRIRVHGLSSRVWGLTNRPLPKKFAAGGGFVLMTNNVCLLVLYMEYRNMMPVSYLHTIFPYSLL